MPAFDARRVSVGSDTREVHRPRLILSPIIALLDLLTSTLSITTI